MYLECVDLVNSPIMLEIDTVRDIRAFLKGYPNSLRLDLFENVVVDVIEWTGVVLGNP